MSDPTPPEPEPKSCCAMRRKVVVGILGVLTDEQCGVGDAELADFMRFDLATPTGKPVLAFRFCPWCGQARTADQETRIVDLAAPEAPREGDFDPPREFESPGEPEL